MSHDPIYTKKIDDLNEKNISCCSLFSFVSCRSSLELLDANGEVKEMVYYDNAIFEALISKYVSLYYNNGDNTSDIIDTSNISNKMNHSYYYRLYRCYRFYLYLE